MDCGRHEWTMFVKNLQNSLAIMFWSLISLLFITKVSCMALLSFCFAIRDRSVLQVFFISFCRYLTVSNSAVVSFYV